MVRYILLLLTAFFMSAYVQVTAATVKVGVLLPLKDTGGRGTVMIEFYRGLLMAVEQVKTEGTDVDVYALDCGSSEAQMQQLLQKGELAHMDVIFGPLDVVQVPLLSSYCQERGIRMVLPFNTPCPQVYGNPFIYQVGVAQELLYPGITSLVMENLGQSNFVFFHSNENDERASTFVNHLEQVMKLRGVSTTKLASGADEFACDRAFNQFRRNVVVIDSRSQGALGKMLAMLKTYLAKHTEYKVSLLGYPEWQTYVSTYIHDFYQFDTYLYSTYYRHPLSGQTLKFEQRYMQNFAQPSRNSFPRAEMLGYDIGLYFIRGISTYGKDFDERQTEMTQHPLQNTFAFQHVGERGGFVNTFVQLVHYSNNNTIQIIK